MREDAAVHRTMLNCVFEGSRYCTPANMNGTMIRSFDICRQYLFRFGMFRATLFPVRFVYCFGVDGD